MTGTIKYGVAIGLIVLVAGFLRLEDLDNRPMHTDEAVNALKFGKLLEEGFYRYDPFEYHGPTLNYLTLIPAWFGGKNKLTGISEITLRSIPAMSGLVLILLIFLFYPGLNRRVLVFSGLLLAISPALVFYSRYYIMEILLVAFTFGLMGSIYRYIHTQKAAWIALSGLFLGLMHATKETFIIALAAMLLAWGVISVTTRAKTSPFRYSFGSVNPKHLILFIAVSLSISILFFSSFFTNWKGITDSVTTYLTYSDRAGQQNIHEHPWYYYLKILGWYPGHGRMIWTELFILIMAGVGTLGAIIKAGNKSGLPAFLGLFSVTLFIIYSTIPYKTPWNILTAYTGMIIVAGYGIDFLIEKTKTAWSRILLVFFMGFGLTHLMVESYLINFVYEAHPKNPYIYGHTSSDIFNIVNRVNMVAEVHPDGRDMFIEVISPGGDYWPLPWYLRYYPNTGWWTEVDMEAPSAPLIIASPEVEKKLMEKLYEKPPPGERDLYMPLIKEYTRLRSGVEIRGYLKKDIWDRYILLTRKE